MRWLLVLSVLIIAAAGLFGFSSNISKTHTAQASTVIAAPAEQIWQRVAEIPQLPQWWKEIIRVEQLPQEQGKPVWRLYRSEQEVWDVQIVHQQSPSFFQAQLMHTEGKASSGSWSVQLKNLENDRTEVTIVQEGALRSPVQRFKARYIEGYDAMINRYLAALKASFHRNGDIE